MPDSKRTVHQQSPSKNGGLTPKFGGLHNAFSTDIRIRRASPRKSDLRGHRTDKTLGEHVGEIRDRELNPASRMDDVYDGRGADDLMSSSQPDEATTEGPMENVPGIYEQDRRTAVGLASTFAFRSSTDGGSSFTTCSTISLRPTMQRVSAASPTFTSFCNISPHPARRSIANAAQTSYEAVQNWRLH